MFSLEKRNIRVAISPSCNLDCAYCDGSKSRKPDKPGAMEDFRSKPLDRGVIGTDQFLGIIEALHSAGFEGITLTGGEPLLNPDWDRIVSASKEIGMARIVVTTNGLLLEQYLKKRRLPEGLTLLTVSLDTTDRVRFAAITGKQGFAQTFKGLRAVKAADPKLPTRANKVLLRSDLDSLPEYIAVCEESRVLDEINLLNLILKDKSDRVFFEREFVTAQEAMRVLSRKTDYGFSIDAKYEHIAKLPSGLRIIIKDTNLTLRNDKCTACPIYCQEGFFTVRVATDGTITACPDYRSELPFIDGEKELKNGSLDEKLGILMHDFRTARLDQTLGRFLRRYGINGINEKPRHAPFGSGLP
jgi:molybdenum cofactor biosynthesis enzyme MoaA